MKQGERLVGTAGEVLGILRDGEPRTKTDLAHLTGQARTTIAQRLGLLVGAGLVRITEAPAATGGRPSKAYEFIRDNQVVLVAELGARHGTFVATNLVGEVLAERGDPTIRVDAGPSEVLRTVVRSLQDLHAEVGGKRIAGIGVGLPGPVEQVSGRPTSPPIMPGWDGFDVAGELRGRFRSPVVVDNDANLLALGERVLAHPGVDDLIYVKVATGVGAGLVVGGRLVHGAEGAAGDIGHVYTEAARDLVCRCGNVGCLEAVAGGLSIAQRLTALGINADGATDVAELARQGNLDAIRSLREAGRAIGTVLATCISLLNPRVIAIGGELAMVGEALIAGVRETIYQRTLPLASQYLRVIPAQGGRLGGAIGAAHQVLDAVFNPAVVDAGFEEGTFPVLHVS